MNWNQFLKQVALCWATENQQGNRQVAAALNDPGTHDRVMREYGHNYTMQQYAAAAWKTYKNNN